VQATNHARRTARVLLASVAVARINARHGRGVSGVQRRPDTVHANRKEGQAMAGFRCAKCGKVAMAQKMCCGRPMKKS
jgi:hypothetical protein